MYARIAARRLSTPRTTSSSPAVRMFARYWTGIRSSSIAGKTSSGSASGSPSASTPSTSDITGESGGMYQTIGSVRYSGCSGSAIRQSIASFQTGERSRGLEPVLGDAVAASLLADLRVVRVEEDVELRVEQVAARR